MALITFLVEDNKTIREHLIPTLEDLTNARVIGTAETELSAVHWLNSHDGHWDLAIIDMFLKEFRPRDSGRLPAQAGASARGHPDQLRDTRNQKAVDGTGCRRSIR